MIHTGRRRSRGGWWPGNARRQPVTVAGVDPVASGLFGLIDRTWARNLDGRSGTVVAGDGFTPGWKATGLFSYANLALTPMVGASAQNRIRDPNIALPSTSGERVGVAPGAAGWSVTDALASITPGVR